MLLADGRVVQGNFSHPPFPPKQVACLAVYVEGLVNGLPCIIITISLLLIIIITTTINKDDDDDDNNNNDNDDTIFVSSS